MLAALQRSPAVGTGFGWSTAYLHQPWSYDLEMLKSFSFPNTVKVGLGKNWQIFPVTLPVAGGIPGFSRCLLRSRAGSQDHSRVAGVAVFFMSRLCSGPLRLELLMVPYSHLACPPTRGLKGRSGAWCSSESVTAGSWSWISGMQVGHGPGCSGVEHDQKMGLPLMSAVGHSAASAWRGSGFPASSSLYCLV